MHRTGWWCKSATMSSRREYCMATDSDPLVSQIPAPETSSCALALAKMWSRDPTRPENSQLAASGSYFLDDLAKPGGLPSADRILHGISIEITKHKNRVISEGLVDPTRQCLSLGDAACAGCPATIMAVLHDTAARPIRTRLDIVVMAIPS